MLTTFHLLIGDEASEEVSSYKIGKVRGTLVTYLTWSWAQSEPIAR